MGSATCGRGLRREAILGEGGLKRAPVLSITLGEAGLRLSVHCRIVETKARAAVAVDDPEGYLL